MVCTTKDPLTFNDLMATLINFSKYVLNRLKIDNRTQDLLLGPAYNLLKGTCSSCIELEYNFQECFNALTDKLDWNNPKGDCYPFDLSKPLPLQGRPSHLTVAADYFFNNNLEFLKSSDPERSYTVSITKTKAARYEIVGIEDMVPTLWGPIKHGYKKDAEKGTKHWGKKRQLLHGYGHLDEIVEKRVNRQLYKFKEGDFVDLHLTDIKDILLLVVQHRLFHLNDHDIDFIMALLVRSCDGDGVVVMGGVVVLAMVMAAVAAAMNEDISRNSISRIKFNKWEELAEKLMRWTAEYGALMSVGRVFETRLRRRRVKQSREIDIEFKTVNEYSVKVNKIKDIMNELA
ncbi:hypothetical protein Tco_1420465 [Tanacetum coccineum]